jgi:hypothetical protein
VRTTALLVPLLMMALVGTLAYEFQVVLPVLARAGLHGGPEVYGFLAAAMGAGAVAGGVACVGAGSTAFIATGNTTLQLTSDPKFRGRVMALWPVTFLGSTPVGGPLIGLVAALAEPGRSRGRLRAGDDQREWPLTPRPARFLAPASSAARMKATDGRRMLAALTTA